MFTNAATVNAIATRPKSSGRSSLARTIWPRSPSSLETTVLAVAQTNPPSVRRPSEGVDGAAPTAGSTGAPPPVTSVPSGEMALLPGFISARRPACGQVPSVSPIRSLRQPRGEGVEGRAFKLQDLPREDHGVALRQQVAAGVDQPVGAEPAVAFGWHVLPD